MRVETTEQFDSDRERQFRWYLTETNLEPEFALDVAERFARAVDHTLELISNVPTIGRCRFPDWANTEVRSFALRRPFNRFLVFYSIEHPANKGCPPDRGPSERSSGLIAAARGPGQPVESVCIELNDLHDENALTPFFALTDPPSFYSNFS